MGNREENIKDMEKDGVTQNRENMEDREEERKRSEWRSS